MSDDIDVNPNNSQDEEEEEETPQTPQNPQRTQTDLGLDLGLGPDAGMGVNQNQAPEPEREFPAETEKQIRIIEFLKVLAKDPYIGIEEAARQSGISYDFGNATLKNFVLAMTRAASDMDFPRRVLTFYNKSIDDKQYHLNVTDVTGLVQVVKEYKEKRNVMKATKERNAMKENVVMQDSVPRQNFGQQPQGQGQWLGHGPITNPEQMAAVMQQVKSFLAQEGVNIPDVKVVNGQLTYDTSQGLTAEDNSQQGQGQYPYHDEVSLMKFFLELNIPIKDTSTRAKIPIFLQLFKAQRQKYWRFPAELIRDLKMYFGPVNGESVYSAFDTNKAYVTDDPAYMNRLTGVGRYDTSQPNYGAGAYPQQPPMMDPMMGGPMGMGALSGSGSSPEERRLYDQIAKNLQGTNLRQLMATAQMGMGGNNNGMGMGMGNGNGHSQMMNNYPQIIYGQDGRTTYQVIPANPETGQPAQVIPIGQPQNSEVNTTAIVMKGLMDIVAANLTKQPILPTDNGLADLTKTIITNMFTQQQHQPSPIDQMNQTVNMARQMQDFMGTRNNPPNPEVEIRKIESDVAIAKMNNDVRLSELEKNKMEAESRQADERMNGVINGVGATVQKVFEMFGDKMGDILPLLLGRGLGGGQMSQGQPGQGVPGAMPLNMGNQPPAINPAVIEQMRIAQMQEALRQEQIKRTQAEALQRGEQIRRQQAQSQQSTIGVPTVQTITPPVQDVNAAYRDQQMRIETPEDIERALRSMSSEQLSDIAFRAGQDLVQAESAVNHAKAELARRRNMGMEVENPYNYMQQESFVPPIVNDMRQYELEQQQRMQNMTNLAAQQMYVPQPPPQPDTRISANELFGTQQEQQYQQQQYQPQPQEAPVQQAAIDDPDRVHVGALEIGNRNMNAGVKEELQAQGQLSSGPMYGFPTPSTESITVNNPIPAPQVEQGDKKSSRYVAPVSEQEPEVVLDENEIVEE